MKARLLPEIFLGAAIATSGCATEAPRVLKEGEREVKRAVRMVQGGVSAVLLADVGGGEEVRKSGEVSVDGEKKVEMPKNIWEMADGEIPLGKAVLVEIDEMVPDPQNPEKKVKQVRKIEVRFPAFEDEDRNLSYDGKPFRLLTISKLFGALDTTVTSVSKRGNIVTIHGVAAGVRGYSSWSPKDMKRLCEILVGGQAVEFTVHSSLGKKKGKIVPAPKGEGQNE